MNKKNAAEKAKKVYYAIKNGIAGVIITAALLSIFATATGDGYVTSDDPLVSLSYVEKMRDELKAEIKKEMEAQIEQMVRDAVADISASGGGNIAVEYVYESVKLNAGEKLIARSGCELLLISGSCKAVTPSVTQTLIDKSSDTSLSNGMDIVKNHLISIPKADGRGIVAVWNGTEIMVRGDYEIVS